MIFCGIILQILEIQITTSSKIQNPFFLASKKIKKTRKYQKFIDNQKVDKLAIIYNRSRLKKQLLYFYLNEMLNIQCTA